MSLGTFFNHLHCYVLNFVSLLKHYSISYYTLDGIFQNRYSGLKETLNGYAYSKAIYYNLKNHDEW